MEANLADLFEAAVDAYPERENLVANGERRTYAEMEARANRLAHHLAAQGIGPGDLVFVRDVACDGAATDLSCDYLSALRIGVGHDHRFGACTRELS